MVVSWLVLFWVGSTQPLNLVRAGFVLGFLCFAGWEQEQECTQANLPMVALLCTCLPSLACSQPLTCSSCCVLVSCTIFAAHSSLGACCWRFRCHMMAKTTTWMTRGPCLIWSPTGEGTTTLPTTMRWLTWELNAPLAARRALRAASQMLAGGERRMAGVWSWLEALPRGCWPSACASHRPLRYLALVFLACLCSDAVCMRGQEAV